MEDTTSNCSEPRIDDTVSSQLLFPLFLRTTMKEKEQWGILDKMPGPFSLLDLVSRATIKGLQDILRI